MHLQRAQLTNSVLLGMKATQVRDILIRTSEQ